MNTIIRMSAVVAFLVTIGGALAVPAYAGDCPGDVQAKPGDSKSQVSAPQTREEREAWFQMYGTN